MPRSITLCQKSCWCGALINQDRPCHLIQRQQNMQASHWWPSTWLYYPIVSTKTSRKTTFLKIFGTNKNSVQGLSIGIPWLYEYAGVSVTNLVQWTLHWHHCTSSEIWKYEMIPLSLLKNNTTLTYVLNLLADYKYSEAHHSWISLYDHNGTGKNNNRIHNHIAEKKDAKNWNCWMGISSVVAKVTMFSFQLFGKYSLCSSDNCPHSSYFDIEYGHLQKENNTGMQQLHLESHSELAVGMCWRIQNVTILAMCFSCRWLQWQSIGIIQSIILQWKKKHKKTSVWWHTQYSPHNHSTSPLYCGYWIQLVIIYCWFDSASFNWAGKTYVLAIIILNNGSHFCSISLVGGKYIVCSYDGMHVGNKFRWWNDNYVIEKQLNVHRISDLWYTTMSEPKNSASKNSDVNVLDYKSSSTSSTESLTEKKPSVRKK